MYTDLLVTGISACNSTNVNRTILPGMALKVNLVLYVVHCMLWVMRCCAVVRWCAFHVVVRYCAVFCVVIYCVLLGVTLCCYVLFC